MFGLTFLFSAALWALPLAGLPLLLHLLFRRKSPVVQFSTLRFIKAAVQQTAARKKVQRWLLLACRALLLALLIWAVAQPSIQPARGAALGGKSAAAVIVVDTSYSMDLLDGPSTLLNRADLAVRALLNGRLRGAKVVILRSASAPQDRPELQELAAQEQLRDVRDIHWSTLTPQPALRPLEERVATAIAMLQRDPSAQKSLIVISDFQKRDFPRALPELKEGRTVLIDLHPDQPRNAAITRLAMQPEQPTPGIRSEAAVEVTGRSGDARQVNLAVTSLETQQKLQLPPQPAHLDGGGHARLSFPVELPPSGWLRLDASLAADEPLAWGRSRTLLLQVPPRQVVALLPLSSGGFANDREHIAWAMDPSQGQASAWPLSVRELNDLPTDANVAVMLADEWPDAAMAHRLGQFVRAGNTLIWFVRPGLEETWAKLPAAQKAALAELLPGHPASGARVAEASTAAIATPADPALAGLTDPKFQIGSISIIRLLPFEALDAGVTPLLSAVPTVPAPGLRPWGLVFRKSMDAGTVFTFATLPDRRYSSIYLHPIFQPMLVQMALRPPGRSMAQNVEIGRPLVLIPPTGNALSELRLSGPHGEVSMVKVTTEDGVRRFIYPRADSPGLYTWRRPADDAIVGMSNVQLPAEEADLRYVSASAVAPPGPDVLIAHSTDELDSRFAALSQPQPCWSIPIALVMLLLCFEALMGSTNGLWKPMHLRGFFPRPGSPQ